MEESDKEMTPEEVLRKQTRRYLAIGLLWLILILVGVALERSGLTSNFLAATLPGEAPALRAKLAEEESQLAALAAENEKLDEKIRRLLEAQAEYQACERRLATLKRNESP
jgi:uncharacterized protein YdcH (DUF465 family)